MSDEQYELEMQKAIEEEEKEREIENKIRQQEAEREEEIDYLLENPIVLDENTVKMRQILQEIQNLGDDEVSQKREEELMKKYTELSKKKWA
jgi:hypothetical protein